MLGTTLAHASGKTRPKESERLGSANTSIPAKKSFFWRPVSLLALNSCKLFPWLSVFDGDVLVALDEEGGAYLGGTGRKQHDPHGHEISVGVEPAARGRGLARALVSRLARRILDDGAVPTYIHDPQNGASCRVAEAAGFPDRGWRAMALWKAGGRG